MVNIAVCFEKEIDRSCIDKEIFSCFSQRNSNISTHLYSSEKELIAQIDNEHIPDIIIYEGARVLNYTKALTALSQKTDQRLVTIAIEQPVSPSNSTSCDVSTNNMFEGEITRATTYWHPTYQVFNYSSKTLWSYLNKAHDLVITDKNHFSYFKRPKYESRSLSDIIYFASQGRKIQLATINDEDYFYQKLDDVEETLQNKNCDFIRIHKSYLVNSKYIDEINRKYIKLINGEYLNISSYKNYQMISNLFKH